MAKIGRGAKTYSVSKGSRLNIKNKASEITATRLTKYIIAGPVNILTLLTSSEIRLIRSPVLCVL